MALCYDQRIPNLQRPKRTKFTFSGKEFAVERGVFDAARHLSGVAFATYLSGLNLQDKRIAEVGTGCGVLAYACWMSGASVVATDVDQGAVRCAIANLEGTGIDVREGDLFEPLLHERFDIVVMNPPYEIGRARRPTLRSPDVLERLASGWREVADQLILAFPTDEVDVLRSIGLDVPLVHRIETAGRELGVFVSS